MCLAWWRMQGVLGGGVVCQMVPRVVFTTARMCQEGIFAGSDGVRFKVFSEKKR
jgi:hypothetical protein